MAAVTIHLINLDRDTERLAEFRRSNAHLGEIRRALAIEGVRLDRADLARSGLIEENVPYTDGALGNAQSHVTLWRQAIEENTVITVAEDDAVFASHFNEASVALLDRLPQDWGIVFWGWNFDAFLWAEIPEGVSRCKLEFSQDDLRNNMEAFRRDRHDHIAVRLLHAFGTMAYSVSPRGARVLLDTCLPLRHTLIEFAGFGVVVENRTIDAMMNRAYSQMKAYACMPPLAASENRHETSRTRAPNQPKPALTGQQELEREQASRVRYVAPTLPPIDSPAPSVMLAILARNKAHVLGDFLRCIEALDYPKSSIHLHVRTNDNSDNTEAILRSWLDRHGRHYGGVDFANERPSEARHIDVSRTDDPHVWTDSRLRLLAKIREGSLRSAQQARCDYYFVVDCDNFITPWTLRCLIEARKPIVAPMLETSPKSLRYSNYFSAVDTEGYYAEHPTYDAIRWRRQTGVFEVPVVHCTYLIEASALPKLAYHDNGPDAMEFVTFARVARAQGIGQWIDNRHGYGELLYHDDFRVSLHDEAAIWNHIRAFVMTRVLGDGS